MLAIITGGSGSIGSMCVYEAARLGFDILLCYNTNKQGAEQVKQMLSDFKVNIELLQADITSASAPKLIADKAMQMGGADILINNAGVADIRPFLETDAKRSEDMICVNLLSHINITREIIPQMLKKQSGSIVNISSVWGVQGASCEVVYSSAKAGMIGFTKSLAKELAPMNITVNCVAPGCIDTKMNAGLDTQMLKDLIPLGRLGDALEVAKAVMFVAKHGYITGQTLCVDGGMNI